MESNAVEQGRRLARRGVLSPHASAMSTSVLANTSAGLRLRAAERRPAAARRASVGRRSSAAKRRSSRLGIALGRARK